MVLFRQDYNLRLQYIKKGVLKTMPIHEYQCEKCGHVIEKIIWKMDDVEKIIECPFCKEKAKQIISDGGVFTVHGYNSNNGYAGHMR